MTPETWKEMDTDQKSSKIIGNGVKKIEKNELETVILQEGL